MLRQVWLSVLLTRGRQRNYPLLNEHFVDSSPVLLLPLENDFASRATAETNENGFFKSEQNTHGEYTVFEQSESAFSRPLRMFETHGAFSSTEPLSWLVRRWNR